MSNDTKNITRPLNNIRLGGTRWKRERTYRGKGRIEYTPTRLSGGDGWTLCHPIKELQKVVAHRPCGPCKRKLVFLSSFLSQQTFQISYTGYLNRPVPQGRHSHQSSVVRKKYPSHSQEVLLDVFIYRFEGFRNHGQEDHLRWGLNGSRHQLIVQVNLLTGGQSHRMWSMVPLDTRQQQQQLTSVPV